MRPPAPLASQVGSGGEPAPCWWPAARLARALPQGVQGRQRSTAHGAHRASAPPPAPRPTSTAATCTRHGLEDRRPRRNRARPPTHTSDIAPARRRVANTRHCAFAALPGPPCRNRRGLPAAPRRQRQPGHQRGRAEPQRGTPLVEDLERRHAARSGAGLGASSTASVVVRPAVRLCCTTSSAAAWVRWASSSSSSSCRSSTHVQAAAAADQCHGRPTDRPRAVAWSAGASMRQMPARGLST